MTNKILSREDILNAQDIVFEDVYVPQWGGTVRVQSPTALEMGRMRDAVVDQKAKGHRIKLEELQVRMCALTIVDETGKRLFSNTDLRALAAKSSGALQVVFEVAARLSGVSDQEVGELLGNSDETPDVGSLSD